jgi:hypothetical protein
MAINKRTYKLTPAKRAALIGYLEGTIPQRQIAQIFGVKRQNIPHIVNQVVCYLVAAGKIDIKSLIRNY